MKKQENNKYKPFNLEEAKAEDLFVQEEDIKQRLFALTLEHLVIIL